MKPLGARIATGTLMLMILSSLTAQQATVRRNVDLRSDASTKKPPIMLLQKGTTLTVIDADPQNGFVQIKMSDGQEGFVSSKAVNISGGPTPVREPGPGPEVSSPAAAGGCDDTLWTHVYNPQRLIVNQKCISVSGTLVDATNGKQRDGVRHEADGDTHGWLRVDSQFENLLNAGNWSDEGGNLVIEIVCKFRVTQADAKSACVNFKSNVVIPPVGSRVRIVGTYVQDTNHAQWMEIHPVASIAVIP